MMKACSSLFVVCEVLLLTVQPGRLERYVLDEYCFKRLPKMRRALYGLTSFQHLLRVCSDIETYTLCLKNTRKSYVPNDYYKVQDFEKHWPSDEDLERAGYIFCMLHFPANVDRYSRIGPDLLAKCRQDNDVQRCENETEPHRAVLEDAVKQNSGLLNIVACNMSYIYWKCLRDQYTACNPDIEPVFDYYFARLGDSCLHLVEEYSVVLFLEDEACNARGRPEAQTSSEEAPFTFPLAESTAKTTHVFMTVPPKAGGNSRYSFLCEFRPLVSLLLYAEFILT